MMNFLQSSLREPEIREILDSGPGTAHLPEIGDPVWCEVAGRPLVQKWFGSIKALATKEIG